VPRGLWGAVGYARFVLGTGIEADLLHRAGSCGHVEVADATALENGVVVLTYRASTPHRGR
jgi:hypothetical protein